MKFQKLNHRKSGYAFLKIMAMLVVILLIFIGCNSGGGGDDVNDNENDETSAAPVHDNADLTAPPYDATGTWLVTETETSDSQGSAYIDSPIQYHVYIDQQDNAFSIDYYETKQGFQDGGKVDGDKYSIEFSYAERGGTTTVNFNLTATSESTGSGTYTWKWSNGSMEMNGGGDLSMVRVDET